MKNLFLTSFTIALLLSTSMVIAQGIEIVTQKNVVVYTSETQSTNIIIRNNQNKTDTIAVSIFPPQYEKISVSLESFLVAIDPNSEKTVKLYFTPAIDVETIPKSFTVTAKSTSDETISDTKTVVLDIIRRNPVYIREVALDKYEVFPEDDVRIFVELFNLEDVRSAKYFLKITVKKGDAIIQAFDETIDPISPKSPQRISEIIKLNKYALPGSYSVEAELKDTSNILRYLKSTSFKIKTVTQPPTEYTHKSTRYNILSSTITIQIKNEGNVALPTSTITESVPRFLQVLFDPDIEPTSARNVDGRVVYSWTIPTLSPSEQYTLTYKFAIWRIWVTLAVLTSIVYVAYKLLSTPEVRKDTRHDGKITKDKEITILIEVKNKALHEIKSVEVVDVIPSIAKVIEQFGTLKPRISKVAYGTLLKWSIGSLKPREERVLTYRIRSVVDVTGPLNLPPAEIWYTDRGHNRVNVVSKQALTKTS